MQEGKQEEVKTGTTTVGLQYDGGVVLATERRASMGYQVAGKNTKKVFEIDKGIGLTTAGSVGDVKTIVRYMRAETNLFKYKKNRKMTPNAAATLMANILQGSKALPYLGMFLLGGYNKKEEKGEVYSIGPTGGILEKDDFYATGSGSQVAYGLLQDGYEKGISKDEALELAVRSIKSASERDIASGDGFAVMIVDESGCEIVGEDRIEEIIQKNK